MSFWEPARQAPEPAPVCGPRILVTVAGNTLAEGMVLIISGARSLYLDSPVK